MPDKQGVNFYIENEVDFNDFYLERTNNKNFADWDYLEFQNLHNDLLYGRFALSPLTAKESRLLKKGLREALLTGILCLRFTHAKIKNACKNLMNIVGIQESIDEILHNFGKIILTGNLEEEEFVGKGPFVAILDVRGPLNAMAVDIELPPGIKVVTETQHIATITEPIQFFVELRFDVVSSNSKGETGITDEEGFSIDPNPPIQKVNSSIQGYEYGGKTFQTLFIEFVSTRPIIPNEALSLVSRKIMKLFQIVLQAKYLDYKELEKGIHVGVFCVSALRAEQSKWIKTILEDALYMVGGRKHQGPLTDEEDDSIDSNFTPVQKLDCRIESYEEEGQTFQRLFIEIWTKSPTEPQEALWEASAKILELFSIFLQTSKEHEKDLKQIIKDRTENKRKHEEGLCLLGSEEEESGSSGLINQKKITHNKIVYLNAEVIWLVHCLKPDYDQYNRITDQIVQELRASLKKLREIQKGEYSEQRILVHSIAQEIEASLQTYELLCMTYDITLRSKTDIMKTKETEIADFESSLIRWESDEDYLNLQKMNPVEMDRSFAELQYQETLRKEKDQQSSQQQREQKKEEMKKRRFERQNRERERKRRNREF
uniref:RpoA-like protein n=1 Tax=Pelargonium endlicherianum TaxID=158596 RepID=A0A1Y0K5P2_9ROSI|nr:RpoA-like protein [Pelargonium endlicherianum]